ncbi:hypothetical protein [Plantactinospora sp. GCM10030261]|uniref:hypothetical protein n=1 Tax=Plantactinospora sp. GCM10030261 TaxID=3273420 RepID=UPI00361CB042
MPMAGRLSAMLGSLILTLGIALVPSSPASAAEWWRECREPTYVGNGFEADVCVFTDGARFSAQGWLYKKPSNCGYWRVYLVNNSLEERHSTSKLSCGTRTDALTRMIWEDFPNGVAKARVKVWDTSSTPRVILSIDSPWLHYAVCPC